MHMSFLGAHDGRNTDQETCARTETCDVSTSNGETEDHNETSLTSLKWMQHNVIDIIYLKMCPVCEIVREHVLVTKLGERPNHSFRRAA